jgi:hypothetical protein
MGIRIPQNQIVANKYTAGKEYMYKDTYREYQGYYYELNNKLFAGKEFNSNAPELVLLPKNDNVPFGFNDLLTRASTYVYGKVSGVKTNSTKIPSYIYRFDTNKRYFAYNIVNRLIKEINKETFDTLLSNSLYRTIELTYQKGFSPEELNKAEQTIPGIKTFVSVD